MRQRITPPRRTYNQWVGNETMEDYALRFTANRARRFSPGRVADTAFGATAFLALEAIGGAITLAYGASNAIPAIIVGALLIGLTAGPIAAVAARAGVDIDLLTRGAGFGYLGSTITSLIYASFTFIFFAIEASIVSGMLAYCFGIPAWLGNIVAALVVLPMVAFGITFISRFQSRTRSAWIVLNFMPLLGLLIAAAAGRLDLGLWHSYGAPFDPLRFGAALSVIMSLVVQIGEQVDFLRFLPSPRPCGRIRWWSAVALAGPGWVVPAVIKLLAGSLLVVLAIHRGAGRAAGQPVVMYLVAWQTILPPGIGGVALPLTVALVLVAQLKINVTNAYAGSIAWSNFFSRLTHRHPGRIVWMGFNVSIALLLMELGIYHAIEPILSFYSVLACAWVGSIFGDLAIAKALRLAPPAIEFKRAYLYDLNPVGLGAMLLAVTAGGIAMRGLMGPVLHAFAPVLALATAILAAPAIAAATGGRFYLARRAPPDHAGGAECQCGVCAKEFEIADMAHCPVYAAPICSLCCSLEARCNDACKPHGRYGAQLSSMLAPVLPGALRRHLSPPLTRFILVFVTSCGFLALVLLTLVWLAQPTDPDAAALLVLTGWHAFFVLAIITGVVSWLFVLARESRQAVEQEVEQQTALLLAEIEAHRRTDAERARACEVAEAANLAKSRFVVGVSHELRSPLNAILGYAQLLEIDGSLPEGVRRKMLIIRRSGEHLSGLIEGLMDIAKIEAGRIELERQPVRLHEFLTQIADMFSLQAAGRGIAFTFDCPHTLPETVMTDPTRLRQILINLLSNAIKFTREGEVRLAVRVPGEVAEFTVSDTGPGIADADVARIFEPFERLSAGDGAAPPGIGLGLTITKLLAQILGGEVTVTSSPGRGSRFTLRLMLSHRGPGIMVAAPRPVFTGYIGRRRRILVTDDNVLHRTLIEDALGPLGFDVLTAPDAEGCLRLAASAHPDLFIVDFSMPDIGGAELGARLRASGHESTPIILLSADAGEIARRRKAPHPFYDALAKPVDLRSLLATIGASLRIEWTSDQSETLPAGAGSTPDLSRLAPYAVDLRRLAEIGFLRPLRARLDEIADGDPDLAAPVGVLRAKLDAFQLVELAGLLASLGGEVE